jgi:hypothetical protein
MELSQTEKLILADAKFYINEKHIARLRSQHGKKEKQVKGIRKKAKKFEKTHNLKKATPLHALEAILGSVKMQVLLYLRQDCSVAQVKEWIYGIDTGMAHMFVSDIRLDICRDMVDILEKGYCYFKPQEVHDWFFKSGFLKRSNNLFKELYNKESQFAYTQDILTLREHYMRRAGNELTRGENVNDLLFQNKDVNVIQDDHSFYIGINQSKRAIDLVIQDMEADSSLMRKARYIRSQINSLLKIMKDYMEASSDHVERMTSITKEIYESKALKQELGPFYRLILASCRLEGIKLSESTREVWGGYYNELRKMPQNVLKKEIKWLGVA